MKNNSRPDNNMLIFSCRGSIGHRDIKALTPKNQHSYKGQPLEIKTYSQNTNQKA